MINRRQLVQTAAIAALAPGLGIRRFGAFAPAHAQSTSAPEWHHALSLFGDIKYPADFKRFDYVNPNAPKGGTVRQYGNGSFDNFNPVIAGLKGEFAEGVGLIYETLAVQSQDKTETAYGCWRKPSPFRTTAPG